MSETSTSFVHFSTILPDWFDSNAGQALIDEEIANFNTLVPDQFYRVGLQLGLNNRSLLTGLNVDQAVYCDSALPKGQLTSCSVLSLPEALPFADSSIDLALLPHTLDYCEDPHRVLREISQVLSPEGILVMTGFHPFSLWGVKRRLNKKHAPFDARFVSRGVIQDRLELLGFEPLTGCMLNYRLPQLNATWRDRLGWMDKMGDRWWPTLGAVYVLVVQKKIYSGLGLKRSRKQGVRWFPELKPAQAKVAQLSREKNRY